LIQFNIATKELKKKHMIYTETLAMQLEEHKNPQAIIELVKNKYPASIPSQLARVRHAWRERFGDAIIKSGYRYKHTLKKILHWLNQPTDNDDDDGDGGACGKKTKQQTLRSNVKAQVTRFHNLSYDEQYALRPTLQSQKLTVTGVLDIDKLLLHMIQPPEYIMGLYADAKRAELDNEGNTSELSGAGSDKWIVNIQDTIKLFRSVIEYPHAKYFDLLCALSFVCGKSMAEVAGRADFQQGKDEYSTVMTMKKRTVNENDNEIEQEMESPILIDYSTFMKGVSKLRNMKDLTHLSVTEINKRHGKAANKATRGWIGPNHTFTELRAAYLLIVYSLLLEDDDDDDRGQSLKELANQYVGRGYTSGAVIAATHHIQLVAEADDQMGDGNDR
jgi:hypothetical protein